MSSRKATSASLNASAEQERRVTSVGDILGRPLPLWSKLQVADVAVDEKGVVGAVQDGERDDRMS